jgi:hypothetical protein
MLGVVHELQYIEDEIGEMRRRSSAVNKEEIRNGVSGSRRRVSIQA